MVVKCSRADNIRPYRVIFSKKKSLTSAQPTLRIRDERYCLYPADILLAPQANTPIPFILTTRIPTYAFSVTGETRQRLVKIYLVQPCSSEVIFNCHYSPPYSHHLWLALCFCNSLLSSSMPLYKFSQQLYYIFIYLSTIKWRYLHKKSG